MKRTRRSRGLLPRPWHDVYCSPFTHNCPMQAHGGCCQQCTRSYHHEFSTRHPRVVRREARRRPGALPNLAICCAACVVRSILSQDKRRARCRRPRGHVVADGWQQSCARPHVILLGRIGNQNDLPVTRKKTKVRRAISIVECWPA